MLFLCYPRCSTCRKAQQYLDDHGVEYEYRDIALDNPDEKELKKWYRMSGLELKRFFNTSGMLYRDMNLKNRLETMSEDEQFRLLASNGLLVKRPLLIDGDRVIVGFREKEYDEVIGG